jgi:hypothetical protein
MDLRDVEHPEVPDCSLSAILMVPKNTVRHIDGTHQSNYAIQDYTQKITFIKDLEQTLRQISRYGNLDYINVYIKKRK